MPTGRLTKKRESTRGRITKTATPVFSKYLPQPILPTQRAQSTSPIPTQKDMLPGVKSFAAEVGQDVARNIGSAALTLRSPTPGRISEPLESKSFKTYYGQALFETVFGKDKAIKPIETRIAEAEPKIKEWQENLASIRDTPTLTTKEKIVVDTLSNLNEKGLAFVGIFWDGGP